MRKILKIYSLTTILLFQAYSGIAQADLFEEAKKEADSADRAKTTYTIATFKNSRLINGHSVETIGKGLMDFRVHHRFGFLNQGINELFGLDNANTFIGFDFALSDRLMVGFNRSSFRKQVEGFAKYRLIRQSSGKVNTPVSVTLVSAMVINTAKQTDPSLKRTVSENSSYVHQVILARKFSDKFSLQVMPTLVHFNMVPLSTNDNNLFSLGVGARQKISKRVSINGEYYYQFNAFEATKNSLALGVDIETGGHVFQLHFTNSTGTTEPTFIHQTNGDWENGDIHFGFNVSRIFNIGKKKKSTN